MGEGVYIKPSKVWFGCKDQDGCGWIGTTIYCIHLFGSLAVQPSGLPRPEDKWASMDSHSIRPLIGNPLDVKRHCCLILSIIYTIYWYKGGIYGILRVIQPNQIYQTHTLQKVEIPNPLPNAQTK